MVSLYATAVMCWFSVCWGHGTDVTWSEDHSLSIYQDGKLVIVQRHKEAENTFIQLLQNLHTHLRVQEAEHQFAIHSKYALQKNWFFLFFDKMKEEKVDVYGYDQLKNFKIHKSKPTTKVNISSNLDWFDTKIEIVRTKIMNFATSMSLFSHHKICFIDEADYLSKSSQASLRGVIEDTSKNCRYIFTANDMSKIHPALCSRLMPICFDMNAMQIEDELLRYKERVIAFMKEQSIEVDELRINRVIEMNFPDYRTIANKLEFEML